METGKKQNVWFVVSVILFVSAGAWGRVYYVDADAPGSTLGTSWEEAFIYLEDALWVAGDGDEIRVAQGVYKPAEPGGEREASFEITSAITIKGGYAGYGEPNPDARDTEVYKTILSGDLNGDDADVARPQDLLEEPTRAENSYHVVRVNYYYSNSTEPVLDGFTITGGSADGAYRDNNGGGMYVYYSRLKIIDCKFINNKAGYGTGGGGGALAFRNSRIIFTRCDFICNAVGRDGGALLLDGCGTCNDSYAEFQDCKFVNNFARNNGGALYNTSNTLTNMINCILVGNVAEAYGGALYNTAYSYGTAEYTVSVSNCTFTGNWAGYGGGAVYEIQDDYSSHTTLLNSIIWGNGADEIRSSGTIATYSDISCTWPGVGNIMSDPLFVEPGYWAHVNNPSIVVEPDDENAVWIDGDYHLQAGSPCIDAGDPAYLAIPSGGVLPTEYFFDSPLIYVARTSETDLDGQSRVAGDRVDMGVYELQIIIPAEAEIIPHNINLSSKGKWFTCNIRLGEGFDVTEIDPGSIRLEETIRPLWMWFDEAKQVAMFKFKRSDVQAVLEGLEPGEVELLVSGELNDGAVFGASAAVKIVGKH